MANVNLPPDTGDDVIILKKTITPHWRLFLVEGFMLMLLGAVAIVVPAIASLTISIFLGWLLLISGIFRAIMTIISRHAPGFWWSLLSAFAAVFAGGLLLAWPVGMIISLTFVLTAFLIVEGFSTLLFAIEHRREVTRRWGLLFLSGLLDLMLAALIILALPGSAIWVLGVIVGVDMLFGGYALIAMALDARKESIPSRNAPAST